MTTFYIAFRSSASNIITKMSSFMLDSRDCWPQECSAAIALNFEKRNEHTLVFFCEHSVDVSPMQYLPKFAELIAAMLSFDNDSKSQLDASLFWGVAWYWLTKLVVLSVIPSCHQALKRRISVSCSCLPTMLCHDKACKVLFLSFFPRLSTLLNWYRLSKEYSRLVFASCHQRVVPSRACSCEVCEFGLSQGRSVSSWSLWNWCDSR